jgi:hypothetical protein
MRKIFRLSIILGLCFSAVNCSGVKSGAKNSSKPETRFDFGRSTRQAFLFNVIADVLRRSTYQLHEASTGNFIETEWLLGEPNAQEQEVRITEVRHRAIVTITSRRTLADATLRLHYEVKHGEGKWIESDPSPEVIAKIKSMQDEVKRSLARVMQQEL